ncbi:uncharacterized protein PRCAT00002140001 [Priceomyces carsonii]|uniref:uncharacterized protein n=1 Tax=Priceomyces carsonii TaxID=28549 RepID=UPI002EDB864F|nr:unnamed protein product [Priceomyces carsonii]
MSNSLLASLYCEGEVNLIIGVSNVAALRISAIIEAGAKPILISEKDLSLYPQSIRDKLEEGKLKVLQKQFELNDLVSLGRAEVDNVVDRVFVTLPVSDDTQKAKIYKECKRLRIPINTSDSPDLCTFSLLSTYTSGDFKLGVSTSGKGCKLASRLRRELANSLPPNIGEICNKVGDLRRKIIEEDFSDLKRFQEAIDAVGENDDDAVTTANLNSLVDEFNMSKEQKKLQRSRWLSQIVEYYPLNVLANLSMENLTSAYKEGRVIDNYTLLKMKSRLKGSISLVGSGPGSVSLLTLGAVQAIHTADLILADKLVPQQVLDLIPKATKVFIARKFPGNAEKAQEELLTLGLKSLEDGNKVVRLKQGDPYIFGRGGEEFKFFVEHGYKPTVIPGITSALAAPVLANAPATHRDVADQVLICTGTGRRGALPNLPEFVKSRTTIFLMALHRVDSLVSKLIEEKKWDPELPAAIVERASCPDQRVIRCKLLNVGRAMEACGSRPPGLLVTGYVCDILSAPLKNGEEWVVEEGCGSILELGPISGYINSKKIEES